MKKSLKELSLNKKVISCLDLNKIDGQGTCNCGGDGSIFCFTQGALNTCPPPGMQCF